MTKDLDIEAHLRGEIEAILASTGLHGRPLTIATLRIEALFEHHVMATAGEGLADVLAELGKNAFAEAIRRRILRDTTSFRDAAAKFDFSHETLRQAEASLARDLGDAVESDEAAVDSHLLESV